MSEIFCPMITAMRYHTIVFIPVLLLCLFGCAHKPEEIKSAEVLFHEATKLAEQKKVEKATETFMEVRTYYPGHDLARKSLIAIAEINFEEKLYDEAMESYKEYRLLYPTDPEAGDSLYKIGLCYFNQISTYDRDQSNTAQAISILEEFINTYPNSPYAEQAREKLVDARTTMAKHYLYIGKFYLKNKNLEAACKRFNYVRRQYPDIDVGEDLDDLIAKSCKDAP